MADVAPISVIIPARNCPNTLAKCLYALTQQTRGATEILVVDDASTDDTARAAKAAGANIISLPTQLGPAGARNHGAEQARGDILFFVDADVVVANDAIERVAAALATDSGFDAVFGSYDDEPGHPGWISQYRNLLHHHTHQIADATAQTFWSGCGAIRASVFKSMMGFNADLYPTPSVEDIELGYRMSQQNHRIRLDKNLLATHLKQWTLRSMVKTDIVSRAIPWTRLILKYKPSRALNTRPSQQLCALLSICFLPSLAAAIFISGAWALPPLLLSAIIALNGSFFMLLRRKQGAFFAMACVPLHLIYYLSAVIGYGYALAESRLPHMSRTGQ